MTGENIFVFRKMAGLTRREVAEAVNISVRQYIKIECDEISCDEQMLKRLAAVFNVDLQSLYTGKPDDKFHLRAPMEQNTEHLKDAPERLTELDGNERRLLLLIRQIKDKEAVERMLFNLLEEEAFES